MSRALLFVVAVLAICGCGPDKRPMGVWKYDVATLKGASGKLDPTLAPRLAKIFESAQMEFHDDGTFQVSGIAPGTPWVTDGSWTVHNDRIQLEADDAPALPEIKILNKDLLEQPVRTATGGATIRLVRK